MLMGVAMQPQLSHAESLVYDALCDAAAKGEVCPTYLDLNELAGYESTSWSPTVVKRLQAKGLIEVEKFQRFRRVKILATGQWTAKPKSQHSVARHVPRGAKDKWPLYNALVAAGMGEEEADRIAADPEAEVRFRARLARVMVLLRRRKHYRSTHCPTGGLVAKKARSI